jgi:hypothetical protein
MHPLRLHGPVFERNSTSFIYVSLMLSLDDNSSKVWRTTIAMQPLREFTVGDTVLVRDYLTHQS